MDENYLDSLLNEITLDEEIDNRIEEELDDELVKRDIAEKEAMETVDSHVENDSKEEVEAQDSHIGVEQLDELDELDSLADLDMDGLDFDDIDFDDIDVTNIKLDNNQNSILELDDLEDIDIDEFFKEEALDDSFFEEIEKTDDEIAFPEELGGDELFDDYVEDDKIDNEAIENTDSDVEDEDLYNHNIDDEYNNQENNDYTEEYIFNNEESSDMEINENNEESQYTEEINVEDVFGTNEYLDDTNKELDDLFAMLGIEDEGDTEESTEISVESSKIDNDSIELTDIPEKAIEAKKKKTFSQIIFGDPDEDEEEGISLEELEAKKAAKLARKEEKKAAKEISNQKKNENKVAKEAVKKKNEEEKLNKKLAKKRKEEQENIEAVPEKKISKVYVIILAVLGIAIIGVLFLGTKAFNYKLVIEKAGEYFSREKYRLAYDEVYGVDVKEEDQDLKDRIYTVMYVERLYESYNTNFYELKRYDKALDSLLRGLIKYDEHYEEAVELDIVNDIDKCKSKIVDALEVTYGISLEEANSINEMNNYDYVNAIEKYSSNITPEDETQAEEE